jgi:GntR family transcriptional regulator, transcriptional repressor for pyruvate dehydrogenase complex
MKKISKRSLQSEITEGIKDYIERNSLKPGDVLPSQLEMTKLLGISRSSLREALRTMEAHGIVEIRNGKGVYVKDLSSALFLGEIELNQYKETLLEIIGVRKVLEREIIRLVCLHATEAELENIQKIMDLVMEKYNRRESTSLEDLEYHTELNKVCHNEVMVQVAAYIRHFYLKLWENPYHWKAPFTETIPYHQKTFEQIRLRNYRKAQAINDKVMDMIVREILEMD